MLILHALAAVQCRDRPRRPDRKQGRPHRHHAERERRGAQRLEQGIVERNARQLLACRAHGFDVELGQLQQVAQREVIELEPQRQPLEQRGRGSLVLGAAFVERHHEEARGRPRRDAVALDDHLARVQGRSHARRQQRAGTLGAGNDHQPAVGLGQQAAFGHRPAGAQRRHEIEPAEQAVIVHVHRARDAPAPAPAAASAATRATGRAPDPGRRARRHRPAPDRPRTRPPRALRRPTARRPAAALLMPRTVPAARARRARSSRHRRADRAAGDAAAPPARCDAGARRRPCARPRGSPARGPHASA